jgi:hypothetical protein
MHTDKHGFSVCKKGDVEIRGGGEIPDRCPEGAAGKTCYSKTNKEINHTCGYAKIYLFLSSKFYLHRRLWRLQRSVRSAEIRKICVDPRLLCASASWRLKELNLQKIQKEL